VRQFLATAPQISWTARRLGAGWKISLKKPMGKNHMDRQAFQAAWGKLMARAWGDAAFKERLLTTPEAVFQEYGFAVPANISIKVVSNDDRMIKLRCTRRGAPEWYVECTSSCRLKPETSSQMQVWSMWRAGWTDGVTISLGAGR
jgi:hypothetical protein